MNAGDVITGPDGRTYLVLGARPGSSDWVVVDVEPVARQTVADVLPALAHFGASAVLLDWLRKRPALSWQEAWDTCERGDQLVWLVARLAGEYGSPAYRRAVGCLVEIVYAIAWPWLHDYDALAESACRCLDALALFADGEVVDARAASEDFRVACARVNKAGPGWLAARSVWSAVVLALRVTQSSHYYAADAVRSGADAAATDSPRWPGARFDAARAEALRCAAEIVRAHYPAAPEIGGAS